MTGVAAAREALRAGRADLAVPMLQALHCVRPDDSDVVRLLGFALHAEQRLAEAHSAFARVSELICDAGCSFGHAQTRYELGLPAANLFADA